MTFNQYWYYLTNGIPHEVYVWVLVFFCVGTVMLIGFFGLNRGGRCSLGLLLAEYVSLIYCSTVIFRGASIVREFCFIPFWSYCEPRLFVENVMNVVIFVPVGLLLGGVFRSMTWKRVLMIGLCLSVGIEALQFVMKKGFSELDDVMHNTLGCLIGYGLFRLLSCLTTKRYEIQVIDKDMLNELLQKTLHNERHRYAYDLRNSPEDTSQRIFNTLLPDTEVPIHRHEDTNETTICLCGNLHVVFYEETTEKGKHVIREGGRRFVEVDRYNLYPEGKRFGVQIPKGVWHSVEPVFPSCIIEVKDGKYVEKK